MESMENKTVEKQKQQLIDKLSPVQKEYLEALDWFYNGGRGAGRTYLSCTVALIGLLNGNYETFVLDHTQWSHEGIGKYTKAMIYGLANEIELAIEVKDVRNGFIIKRAPEFVQWEKFDRKKSMRNDKSQF